MPLWAGLPVSESNKQNIVNTINALGILNYPGGVPTSIILSNQQWDFPNAWPPLQWFLVKSLENLGVEDQATFLVEQWVESNYAGFIKNNTKEMYEKYNATVIGETGTGGEYEAQVGFGWTNGVILDMLLEYFANSTSKQS